MVNPIVYIVSQVISLINLALMVYIILGLLINFNVVNRWHPIVGKIYEALHKLFEPMLAPIRRRLPDLGGMDISPIVLILILNFLAYTLRWLFATAPVIA